MFARKMFDIPGLGWRNPFTEMERMRRQMDVLTEWMFRGSPSRLYVAPGVFPLINITEDGDHYYVRAELPGMKADDLDIQVVGRNLTLSGERQIASEGDTVRYHRRERDAGRFSRAIALPGDIAADKVSARMVSGMLTVTIPKSEGAKPRQISVN